MFLASKHACDPVCSKPTALPTTVPVKRPPGNGDGGSPALPSPKAGEAWSYAQAR